jgi:predicted MFS family arabinose efflux permease
VIAGALVHYFGYRTGLLFLGAVASGALAILYFSMPETLKSTPIAVDRHLSAAD